MPVPALPADNKTLIQINNTITPLSRKVTKFQGEKSSPRRVSAASLAAADPDRLCAEAVR